MTSFYYHYQNPSGFCFLCKLGLLLFKSPWDYIVNLNVKEKNEMNSGPSSKKTSSVQLNGPFFLNSYICHALSLKRVTYEFKETIH